MDWLKKKMTNINQYRNIKPLVIGIGVAGKRHLEAQLNSGIKTGIFTTNPITAESLNKQKNVIVFDNLKDAIEWSNLVHVCTPDDKHTEFVAMALKKRKTVLCEKSFTTNLRDALYLQKLAHKYDTPLIIGQNYRLTPTFAEIKKKVMAGDLGKISWIETTYLHDITEYQKRSPLNKNRDFLYIGGSHAVDLMCWIVNEQIADVHINSKNELNYQITVKFVSGLTGTIKLDASSPREKHGTDLIVTGEKGKLTSHNKEDQLKVYLKDKKMQIFKLPNNETHTIAMEVKIVDDYLSGKLNSYSPLPGVDEAVDTIKILSQPI